MSDKTIAQRLQVLSTLVARANLASAMGMSYGNERDLYTILGYKLDLTYVDYYSQWKRQDIAKAVINRPINYTWRGPLEVMEVNDANETPFEKAFKELSLRLKLKAKFISVDRYTGLGRYGALLLGFDDVTVPEKMAEAVSTGNRKLLFIRALNEVDCKIVSYVDDTKNERYGAPLMFQVTLSDPTGSTKTHTVHYSRIIQIVDSPMENDHVGTPRLEAIFNRLQDIEKLTGGSAEMFWRGARPGYTGDVDPEYTMGTEERENLEEQIDEFEHNLKRIFINEGVSMKALEQQIADPTQHIDVQIQMISAETGIPKRILTGSERGELSSGQDSDEWNGYVQTRRDEFAEPLIIRPFIDACIKYGVLPTPKDGTYFVNWQDLFSISEEAKIDIGVKRTNALVSYSGQPMAENILPPQAFFELFLGLSQEQITLITQIREEAQKQEESMQEQEATDVDEEEDIEETEETDDEE